MNNGLCAAIVLAGSMGACSTTPSGSRAGVMSDADLVPARRIVLVDADGTVRDIGEFRVSDEALDVTNETGVVGFAVDGDGHLVGVDLRMSSMIEGLADGPGPHPCAAILTDLQGLVIGIVPLDENQAPPVCNPHYEINGDILKVTCESVDCPETRRSTLHKERLANELRYWCPCDSVE